MDLSNKMIKSKIPSVYLNCVIFFSFYFLLNNVSKPGVCNPGLWTYVRLLYPYIVDL